MLSSTQRKYEHVVLMVLYGLRAVPFSCCILILTCHFIKDSFKLILLFSIFYNSRWKDMFNSEVEPLDFDEPASKKKKTDEILPKAFKGILKHIHRAGFLTKLMYQ